MTSTKSKQFDISFDSNKAVQAIKEVSKQQSGEPFKKLMVLFERKVKTMQEVANLHQVRGTESEENAVAMGTQAKSLNKSIDDIRKKAKRPQLDLNKEIDKHVRPVQHLLDHVESSLKEKIVAHRIKVRKLQEEEEAKARAIEAANKKSELKMPVPKSKALDRDLSESVETVTGGSAHFQEKKVFKLADIKKVPREFLTVDWKKVKEAEKAGVTKIAGFDLVDDFGIKFHR